MSMSYAPSHLSVPPGFEYVLESLAREVLREQPKDIIAFAADYFKAEVIVRDKCRDEGGITDQADTPLHKQTSDAKPTEDSPVEPVSEPEEGTQARDSDNASADEGQQEAAPGIDEDELTVDTSRTTSPECKAIASADEEVAKDESEDGPPESSPPSETVGVEGHTDEGLEKDHDKGGGAEDDDEEVVVAQETKEETTDDDVTEGEDDGKAEDDQPALESEPEGGEGEPIVEEPVLESEPEVTSGEGEPVVEEPVLESEPEGGEGEPVVVEPVTVEQDRVESTSAQDDHSPDEPSEPEQGDTEGEVVPSSTSLADAPEDTEPESTAEGRVDSAPPGDEPSDQQTGNEDTPTDDEQTQ